MKSNSFSVNDALASRYARRVSNADMESGIDRALRLGFSGCGIAAPTGGRRYARDHRRLPRPSYDVLGAFLEADC
jgi:hypothetical protein